MLKNHYDVIVVGAGPAGSSTAEKCADNGLDVLLLEKRQEIGAPLRCAEGFSKNNEKSLGLEIPKHCISQKVEGAVVHAPNKKAIKVKGAFTKGYILERKRFDKWLAEKAAKAGAKVVTKATVYKIIKKGELIKGVKANINGEEKEITTNIVVAADGVESTVLKKAGIVSFKKPHLVDSGFQYLITNIEMKDPKMIEVHIGNNIAPRGYCWIFPKNDYSANVGIGISGAGKQKTAKKYLDEWIANQENLYKGSIIETVAGCIPVGDFMKNMVGNGILGVGDAVNQVNPIHGGGIAEAIHAGRIAADIIVYAHKKNDFSSETLRKYNIDWWEKRGNKLKKIEKVRETFEKMDDTEMNNLAKVVAGRDLEEMARGNKTTEFIKLYLQYRGKNIVSRMGL